MRRIYHQKIAGFSGSILPDMVSWKNQSDGGIRTDGQEKLLDYETIKAAVAGEKWATEKVLAHYADYIDELSAVEIRQPGGKVKKVIDEDMRQHISLKLLEALPSFPLEQE